MEVVLNLSRRFGNGQKRRPTMMKDVFLYLRILLVPLGLVAAIAWLELGYSLPLAADHAEVPGASGTDYE
jgi:hypothetical protein